LEEGGVKLYVCGPTVYGDPHIGNFRTFTVGDIVRRWLEYRGYDVFHVMNITDIEDKTIRDSGKEGISLKEFTDRYTASFLRGLDRLNIRRATVYPVATEYVPQMTEFVQALLDSLAQAMQADFDSLAVRARAFETRERGYTHRFYQSPLTRDDILGTPISEREAEDRPHFHAVYDPQGRLCHRTKTTQR